MKKFTAKCEFDLAAYRGYVRDGMPKGLKYPLFIFIIALVIVAAVQFDVTALRDGDMTMLVSSAVDLALILLLACTLIFMPRILLRQEKKLGNRKNGYTFDADSFKVDTTSEKINGSAEIPYSAVTKIKEKENYYYIYCGRHGIYFVDRSTVAGGTAEELSALLREAVGKKRFRGKNK